MRPARSLLFIPGNRESWIENAHGYGADVIIFDLEDSVPPEETETARELVADNLADVHDRGQRVFVRINGHPGDAEEFTAADIEAVMCEELDAIVVPKLEHPEDVERLDTVLTHIERRDDLSENGVKLIVSIEAALGMKNVYELCVASDRVGSITCGAVKGTDTNYALGFEWTGPGREGLETLHLREKAILDARAAGIEDPFAGTYVDVSDIEGLREDMQFSREMGYTGYVVIHPSHVEHANEIFAPDEEKIEYWLGVREALIEAQREGKRAIRYEGEMIDTANLKTANRYLRRAKSYEDDLDFDVDLSGLNFNE
jgi:citrate lyase subunit beta/citryl-CoA lyase